MKHSNECYSLKTKTCNKIETVCSERCSFSCFKRLRERRDEKREIDGTREALKMLRVFPKLRNLSAPAWQAPMTETADPLNPDFFRLRLRYELGTEALSTRPWLPKAAVWVEK